MKTIPFSAPASRVACAMLAALALAAMMSASPVAAGLGTTACQSLAETSLSAQFGWSVAGAGDVNGDGFVDVIVGAADLSNGQSLEGRVYLYSGGSGGLAAFPAWFVESNQASARLGWSVSGAGDVNGDGFDDVIVGAPLFDNGETDEGAAYVYLGGPGGLSGTPAWTIEGNVAGVKLGHSVASAGDVNSDGFGDVIVGVPLHSNGQTGEGRAQVFLGGASGLSTTAAWTVESNQANANLGHSVAWAGDLNNDGYDDVIVGAPWYSSFAGEAYVYHGGPAGLPTTPARVLTSLYSGGRFGWSVARAGDVNGDGYDDVIVGSRLVTNGQGQEGAAQVFHGGASGVASAPAWTVEGNQLGGQSGYAVAGAGDLDANGCDDVLVGIPYLDPSGDGGVRVYFGGIDGLSTTVGHTLLAPEANTQMGWSLAGVGDIDGDLDPDIAIGAPVRGGFKGSVYVHCGTTEAVCDVQPPSLAFGAVPLGGWQDLTFTITNTGTGTLGGSVSEACADFSIVSGGGAYALTAGQSRVVTVRFQPLGTGLRSCAIATSQALCGSVGASGTGVDGPTAPGILSVADVGNDQGRQVRVTFARSPRDVPGSPTPIVHYEAYRRIDPLPPSAAAADRAVAAMTMARMARSSSDVTRSDPADLLAGWDFIGTIPAHGDPEYLFIAPTLADSTVTSGAHWSVFFLRAGTANPLVFFDSTPDSGYSIDNLVPGVPTGLAWAGSSLVWNASADADFDYFRVYGSSSAVLDASAVLIGSTVSPGMPGGGHAYHHVTATDFSGNQGPAATIGTPLDAPAARVPARVALGQNHPNPFTDDTRIRFDLPVRERVQLAVFDAGGRLVRLLASGAFAPGHHEASWDGRDGAGLPVPAGIYYYGLRAGDQREAKRMLRIR